MLKTTLLSLLLCLDWSPVATASPPVAAEASSPATVGSDLAEVLGKAVLTWCRPTSVEHGSTMLSHDWSVDGEFGALTTRVRWYGLWSKKAYSSKIRIEMFLGGELPRVTSIDYDDDCRTPCEFCKKLSLLKDTVNKLVRDALV